jgi:hypothetical protein
MYSKSEISFKLEFNLSVLVWTTLKRLRLTVVESTVNHLANRL